MCLRKPSTLTVLLSVICCSMLSMTMYVPVRPTPALQHNTGRLRNSRKSQRDERWEKLVIYGELAFGDSFTPFLQRWQQKAVREWGFQTYIHPGILQLHGERLECLFSWHAFNSLLSTTCLHKRFSTPCDLVLLKLNPIICYSLFFVGGDISF